jgi:hypothetical protein
VCRAGYKLEAALDAFGVEVAGCVALDAGLSTGGFTDCLLQRGARHVYGVDVGYGQVMTWQRERHAPRHMRALTRCAAPQVHERIRTDARVTVMERVNLRHLAADALPEPVDVATLDVSFISLLKARPRIGCPSRVPPADVAPAPPGGARRARGAAPGGPPGRPGQAAVRGGARRRRRRRRGPRPCSAPRRASAR